MALDNGVNERFAEIRHAFKLSKKDFAESMGISPTVIGDVENGKREPSKELLLLTATKYKRSLNWLCLGIGEKTLTPVEDASVSYSQKKSATTLSTHSNFEIPLLTQAQALEFDPRKEIPERMANSGIYPESATVLIPRRVLEYSTDLRAIEVFDSRMYPVLRAGDIAIIEATGWNGDGIYVYRMNNVLHISYVIWTDNNQFKFSNELHKEIVYDPQSFFPIGRVRAVVNDLLGRDHEGDYLEAFKENRTHEKYKEMMEKYF